MSTRNTNTAYSLHCPQGARAQPIAYTFHKEHEHSLSYIVHKEHEHSL